MNTVKALEEMFASDEYQAMLEDYHREKQRIHDELWETVWKPFIEKIEREQDKP